MAKKRKGSSAKGKQRRMDESAIRDVRTWFERMLTNAQRALDLASRMSVDDCNESNDLFWALAKYAENVQESITQLDSINNKILPRLIEIPIESEAEGDTAWADLKGMRIRLAHQVSGDIDPVAPFGPPSIRETFRMLDYPACLPNISACSPSQSAIRNGWSSTQYRLRTGELRSYCHVSDG